MFDSYTALHVKWPALVYTAVCAKVSDAPAASNLIAACSSMFTRLYGATSRRQVTILVIAITTLNVTLSTHLWRSLRWVKHEIRCF